MLIDLARSALIVALGVIFAYLYGFIEHGYIPPAEHLVLRFFNHFSNYHIIIFCLFSALSLVGRGLDRLWPLGLPPPRRGRFMVSLCRSVARSRRLDFVGRRILCEKAL